MIRTKQKNLALLRVKNPVHWPVGRTITRSSLERKVWASNLELVKSDTVLPTVRHRCDTSELCYSGAMTRRWAPETRYTLRRNTASIMKDFIWFWLEKPSSFTSVYDKILKNYLDILVAGSGVFKSAIISASMNKALRRHNKNLGLERYNNKTRDLVCTPTRQRWKYKKEKLSSFCTWF